MDAHCIVFQSVIFTSTRSSREVPMYVKIAAFMPSNKAFFSPSLILIREVLAATKVRKILILTIENAFKLCFFVLNVLKVF